MEEHSQTSTFGFGKVSLLDGGLILALAIGIGGIMPAQRLSSPRHGDFYFSAVFILLGGVLLIMALRFFCGKNEISDTAVAEKSLIPFFSKSILFNDIERFAIHNSVGKDFTLSQKLTVRKKDGKHKAILLPNKKAQALFLEKMKQRGLSPIDFWSL